MTIGDVVVYNGKYGSKPDDFLHLVTSKPWIVNGKELVQLDYKQGGRCTDDLALFPIKPCPFCGSTEIDFGVCTGVKFGMDYVECDGCGAKIETVHIEGDCNASIKDWNRRTSVNQQAIINAIRTNSYFLKDTDGSSIEAISIHDVVKLIEGCETIEESEEQE